MRSLALLLIFALAGCAATGGGGGAPTEPPAPDDGIGELPPQTLRPGACGLFLWTLSGQRRLVFFADDRGIDGKLMLDGSERRLTRTSTDGSFLFGQAERQLYQFDGRDASLALDFNRRESLSGGALVPAGILRLRQPDGSDLVLPVGGLIGCEAGSAP